MKKLEDILEQIQPVSQQELQEGQLLCDRLAKPFGSLGQLESIYARLFAIFSKEINLSKKVVLVYVADNGVVEEGVSSNPQETTAQVALNMIEGKSGICVLSRFVGNAVKVIDIGCKKDLGDISTQKIRYGTGNIRREAAMTLGEAEAAVLVGFEAAREMIAEGFTVLGTGEMGIGNTTTSVALIAALLELDPQELTGYGAGLTDTMRSHKVQVIQDSLALHSKMRDPLEVASCLGGLDILGIAGTFLAAAYYRVPCVIDGVISIAGLLLASKLNTAVLDYAFASHCSKEPAFQVVANALGLSPVLDLEMRLGEGSGCPLAFQLMDTAVYTIEQMPTFEDCLLKSEDYIDIR
ncbi:MULTISPECIES: nicotinate-nucleotide--dimethylbenzimidazole phosphoribosyltransferase [unclassified Streptococcus]|uniref:nicotinate-nucleotide--dimethylbenzimidazole phosphoribosyltransferase n=1 Tax=unclassified Streptococcus TaxID=2608887 RepID=UPI0010727BA4|nr:MULTISPECIES: nicotinate-nucleotide--dimethylbenzimidazole phosphoribosyltransferase [unclassified Streptococcus]MBF0805549.1 nicotinate-nucleotide--dimethylbenzimidazole phosphoribosyltransferase [Streptococcus sp. 19428wA2_WM07]TFU28919.1 nicotinate-nucleotide--dimethylbenzimidazole phosphoribosyltransferase [Streptococcus sp. WM07]